MTPGDRSLIIEVCHGLMNRVLANESDEFPDGQYSKIYRDQEAAVRKLLAVSDELVRVREVLRQNERAFDRIATNAWPYTLAHNLWVAAGLCQAYEAGTDQIRHLWDATDNDKDQATVVSAWEPGCGRPWTGEGYRTGGFGS